MKRLSRREFVRTTTAAGVAAAAAPKTLFGQAPTVMTKGVKPCVVASANGNASKDEKGITCVQRAFTMMTSGSDVLDALVSGVSIVELDPNQTGVGWSGLPNAEGVVQLDASCMHGPKKRAGAVAGIEGVRAPARVAQLVADETDHHLLVGKGAQEFARSMGIKIEEGLINDKARTQWLEWKRRTDPLHYLDPKKRAQAWYDTGLQMVREGLIDGEHYWGTINCDGVNAKGEQCGVTSTSGLAWKIPGRVGDSPIFGAGLYVDGDVGAAGSTGRGESNLFSLCSFLIVEMMRNGKSPKDAGMTALKRVVANTVEKRLLNAPGKPNFNISYYIVNAKGDHAGVSLYSMSGKQPTRFAQCSEDGPKTVSMEALIDGDPET